MLTESGVLTAPCYCSVFPLTKHALAKKCLHAFRALSECRRPACFRLLLLRHLHAHVHAVANTPQLMHKHTWNARFNSADEFRKMELKSLNFWHCLFLVSGVGPGGDAVAFSPLLSHHDRRHCWAEHNLRDALTKRVTNECGKWEYQFDELCYSINAINFPVALLSKMESRMMKLCYRTFYGGESEGEKENEGAGIFFCVCYWKKEIVVLLAGCTSRALFNLSLAS